MFQAFKTFFWETEIRGNGEKKNGSNPVHFHQTRKGSVFSFLVKLQNNLE
jgi:hypothetical protein